MPTADHLITMQIGRLFVANARLAETVELQRRQIAALQDAIKAAAIDGEQVSADQAGDHDGEKHGPTPA